MKKKAEISINITNESNIHNLIEEKVKYIQQIIRNSLISIQNYKKYEIFSNSELIICISSLNELYEKINNIIEKINNENTENMIDLLQTIINKLSIIISSVGTQNFNDLLYITFGSEFNNFKNKNTSEINEKFELITQYVHPIGFKIIPNPKKNNDNEIKVLCSNKIIDEIIDIEKYPMLECFDVDITTKSFYNKVYGIRVVIHSSTNKTIIVNGMIDDLNLSFFSNKYIETRKQEILNYVPNTEYYKSEIIHRMMNSMTLKDILIYGNNDILKKYSNIILLANNTLSNKLEITVKKFIELDIYSQRNTLIDLLIYNIHYEVQYITYLLYDLITVDQNNLNDSNEQKIIYDSLSWKIKNYFKDAMKNTVKYTQDMNQKYDMNRITLEQQIYVLKIPDNIKEKAIIKLKEIKGKPDESCAKAKQYLEGLLKIPFNMYKSENILKMTKQINSDFINIVNFVEKLSLDCIIHKKKYYTNLEISKYIENIKQLFNNIIMNKSIDKLNIKQINSIIQYINDNSSEKIIWSKFKNKLEKTNEIQKVINNYSIENKIKIIDIIETANKSENKSETSQVNSTSFFTKYKEIENVSNNLQLSKNKIDNVSKILDESIYGHSYAKNQILKIICQWISGEQTGYSFGFEGSPGIGKTSLAKKGLAHCLSDENSETRPFSFIALGGSCNGSILEGHSYTYVNSTWGRITDILMESKCMNPIIYIDELDKVSKSEHGKEIIGILTHLIDTTQNDTFQDKYFSGINLDLSKALFIFSYNDASQIDPILLDRIHRIKFENLTSVDKLVIVKKYIIPEINKKMGFDDIVEMNDEVIEFIIDNYTMEPGVRKLKEILFDLYGELNIELLKCNDCHMDIPIIINIDNLENKYLKKYKRVIEKKINSSNQIGIINGLWANSLGKGGIISIESVFYPSSSFLELKLTGLQGDVMKESMNVAKTIAWNLTPSLIKTKLINNFEKTKCQGIHVNCPEASVNKDGPSAGAAITIAMYSLLNNILIKNDVAITGEINLQGKITAIGGLADKIMGGLKSGITKFLFPKENNKDFIDFIQKYGEKPNIEFIEITNIQEIFPHIFV